MAIFGGVACSHAASMCKCGHYGIISPRSVALPPASCLFFPLPTISGCGHKLREPADGQTTSEVDIISKSEEKLVLGYHSIGLNHLPRFLVNM